MSLLIALTALAKDNVLDYQIEGAGGNAGMDLVKVTIVSKKSDIKEEQFGRCAIHGILFRGYSTASSFGLSGNRAPLMGSPLAEQQHADFFSSFFDDTYKGYIQVMSDTRRVVKVGKEYKVTSVVAVSVSNLRRDLEKIGILKSINSGW